jgi:hypothetical protein
VRDVPANAYRGGEYPPTLEDSAPRVVFPRPGGLLEWATTSTGDAFYLRPREGGGWAVSAYDQLCLDWSDYDLGFSDWLYSALSADHGFDILPPLGDERPLSIVSFDVDAMSKGGVG